MNKIEQQTELVLKCKKEYQATLAWLQSDLRGCNLEYVSEEDIIPSIQYLGNLPDKIRGIHIEKKLIDSCTNLYDAVAYLNELYADSYRKSMEGKIDDK